MSRTSQRASRRERPKQLKPMRLTKRDKAVIKAVNDYRVMRQDQIQRLLFPSKNTAQVRLQLLWQHGYLKRHFFLVMQGYMHSPVLYAIDKKGAELLRGEFDYTATDLRYSRSSEPSQNFLYHTTGLSEIRLVLTLSCRRHGYRVATWLDEKAHKADFDRVQVGRRLLPVVPDGYCVITTPMKQTLHFFIEYDRGTEGLRFFKQKMAAYIAYLGSRQCHERYQTNRIRVLTVVEGGASERLQTLQRATKAAGGGRWFYFTSLQALTDADALADPIWHRLGKEETSSLVNLSTT